LREGGFGEFLGTGFLVIFWEMFVSKEPDRFATCCAVKTISGPWFGVFVRFKNDYLPKFNAFRNLTPGTLK